MGTWARDLTVRSVSCPTDLNMRYVAAALLAALGGGEPSAANIKSILSSVGIEADADAAAADKVAAELAGKNLEELIAEGSSKLGSMPSSGGGGGAAAPAAAAAAEAAPAAAAKKEESEEEEDDDMGFGLFD